LGLALDEPKENENTIDVNGIDVLISEEVKPTASLNRIDYVQSREGEGFIIEPKYGRSC
jgi:Fe-S cluster assembly iron-binding protein IscA